METGEGDQELSRLYVLHKHQGKGIGHVLMDTALAHPVLCNAPAVWLDVWEQNERAVRLYESYGFQKTGYVVDGDIIMMKPRSA